MGSADLTHLDTNAALRLYDAGIEGIAADGRAALRGTRIRISPMALLEVGLLFEIGRVTVKPPAIAAWLEDELGAEIDATPFTEIVGHALTMTWTRDPFDRIITAGAACAGATLVTSDRHIREHLPRAIW